MLRFRIVAAAGAITTGTAAVFVACGSAGPVNGFGVGGDSGPPFGDASMPDVIAPQESGAPDARGDGPDAMPPGPPGAIFVHASPIEDLRFCWSVSQDGGPPVWSSTDPPFPSGAPMPASNYPGLARGGAVPLPDAASMVGATLTIWGIDAATLASFDGVDPMNTDCADRLAGDGSYAVPATAVFAFPPIPMNPLPLGSTELLVVSGCAAGDPIGATTRLCGASWTASAGNLRIDVLPVPTPAVSGDAGVLVAQAVQLSPSLAALAGDAGVSVSFGAGAPAMGAPGDGGSPTDGSVSGDAGVFVRIASLDQLLPALPASIPLGDLDATTFQSLGFSLAFPGSDGGPTTTWLSLAESLALVDPSVDPRQYFTLPTNYVVAVVGDPTATRPFSDSDAMYDGTGLHVLVLEVQ